MYRILMLTNIPSPYRVDFFNEMGKHCELTVCFEGHDSLEREKQWFSSKAETFSSVFLNGIRAAKDQFFSPSVIRYIKKGEWDQIVVLDYSTPTSIIAIEYMRLNKIPFIIEADGGFAPEEESKVKYLLKKALISSADYWFSSSRFTTDYLVHYGAKKEKCFLFPFSSLSNDDINCAKTGWPHIKSNEKPTVLFVGQIVYRKGYDLLLEVAKRLDDVEFVFVGGECESSLDNVHFVGFKTKKELAEYYSNADIFVLPTREDIWGLVIAEAMSFGLPVITTDKCVAGLELIKDGENGFIIPVEDEESLAEKINYLLDNPKVRKVIRQNNIYKIKDYSIERMAEEHLKAFAKID